MKFRQEGFTLIEMSIVLVIIGLIIGGILVGRDLIKASEVNAQIAQITKYNSAVNSFRNKYGGLPGDLNIPLANQFGLNVSGCGGSAGQRNGDGLIDGNSAPTYPLVQTTGETALFWQDISSVGYIEGVYPNSGAPNVTCSGGFNLSLTPGTAFVGDYFPAGRIGYGTFLYVYETGGYNWYGLSVMSATSAASGGITSTASIPVIQAYNLDKKIDDGLPTTGSVITAYLNANTINTQTSAHGSTDTTSTCYSGTVGSYVYSLSATANQGAGENCALSFKFQ